MSKKEINILLTSVGRRSYMVEYFQKALDGAGLVHVANSSSQSPAFGIADKCVVTPIIYDKNYIPFLLSYCQENKIDALISLFDIDIPVLSKNKQAFEKIGTRIITAEPWVTEICNDKWKTYLFLKENGFATPKTFLSPDAAIAEIEKGELSYPLFVKPRWGMGSIAVFEAENELELRVFYDKTKRTIGKTYLKYESGADLDECVMIQEKLNGQEHGMDVINDLDGKPCNVIVKKKIAMRAGETDCSVTVDEPEIKALGERLASIFHHPGNLDADVFLTENGAYILEMNARFGGGYPFSYMAGANLPNAIVAWLRGETVAPSMLQAEIGVTAQKDMHLVYLK